MAYQESKSYPDLYPYHADMAEDEELERVKKYSIITAEEDEMRRITRQLNFVADIAGAHSSSSAANQSIGFTSSNLSGSQVSQADRVVSSRDTTLSRTENSSSKTDVSSIARPRPSACRDNIDTSTVLPRPKPPPSRPPAFSNKFPASGSSLGSPVLAVNKVMERIWSDPQLIPVPPRPQGRPARPLTPDQSINQSADNVNPIPVPPRPAPRQLNNIITGSSTIPRCQSVPPLFNTDNDNSGLRLFDTAGDRDTDTPLIRLSPPKFSWMDLDVSAFDPCRPQKYNTSKVDQMDSARMNYGASASISQRNSLGPTQSNQTVSAPAVSKPVIPERAPIVPEGAPIASSQKPNNSKLSYNSTMSNQFGSSSGLALTQYPKAVPSMSTSLHPLDWYGGSLLVFGMDNDESWRGVNKLETDTATEDCQDSSVNHLTRQMSDLMDFSADTSDDPQYMSLEDFDPLYQVKPRKQPINTSATLFPNYFTAASNSENVAFSVRNKPSDIEFAKPKALTMGNASINSQTVVGWQTDAGFGISSGTVAKGRESVGSSISALQPGVQAKVRTFSNSEQGSGQTDTAHQAGVARVDSLDELQDPFSIQDLTPFLEHKRQKHALEQQMKREAEGSMAQRNVSGEGRVDKMPPALQERLTQIIKNAGKEASSYETLQDVTEESAADDETRAFLEMVARIKQLHDPSDVENNRGIVISPRIKHTPFYDLTVKVSVSSKFMSEPVIFTCDVNTQVEHVIGQVLLTLADDLSSVSVNDYILQVYGLSEYTLNNTKLAEYAYVQQCLKLDDDIKFVLCTLASISKPFLRTEADSNHAVFVPKMKQSGDQASRVTKHKLNILTETFYKEVEKLRDAAFKAARAGGTRVNSSGVVQAVKALCTILHQLETVDIMKSVERLKAVVHDQFSDGNESSGSTSSEPSSYNNRSSMGSMVLDDLHVTLEEVTTSVKSMIEMYCRTFHTDFRFESSATTMQDREIRRTSTFQESLLIHLATAHRIPVKWKATYVDYRIFCSLFYGGRQLSNEVISQPKPASFSAGSSTIIWDEWIVFDTIPVSSIPREAKLIFTLIGTRLVNSGSENQQKINIPLGWVSMQLFDQSFELVQGSQLLGLWQGNTIPLGTACSCVDNPSSVLLQVNLPVFEHIYIFPVVPGPLPSVRQDFDSLHPEDRADLIVIIEKDALTRLTGDEADYLWEKRHHLYDIPRALPRILQTVTSWAWASLRETYSMIQEWAPMQPLEALQLLLPNYPDTLVREKAVEQLSQLSCDELYDLLPQLVQTLKFECYHTSALAQLLLHKAGCNVRIAHHLYWLLKEAADDVRYRKRYQLMFGALLSIIGEGMRREMTKQEDVVKMFSSIADKVKAARDKDAVLTRELRNIWDFLPKTSLRLPLNPSLEVTGVDVKSCSYFTSFTVPLKLCLKNIDPQSGDIYAMFKVGDDLRQDMLTLQMVRIMDKLWLLEGLDLKMITFSCQPTSHKQGLVELLMESDTLRKIQVKQGHGVAGSFKDRTIAEWLQKHNPTELDYQKAVDNFTLSCAGYCVATYVLGICDRHNDNIMIKHSGHIFHIDFAKFLGDAQMFGNIKRDRTPFVLTSDMAYVINGGDKPTQKFQVFVDLCCRAFNILRRNSNLFLNLFSLMTLSGIPGVTADAPKYIQKVLLPDRSDAEAVAEFTRMINVSLQSIFTQFNFFLHNLAQMKFIGHDEGVLLSFIPKTYSMQTDGKIRNLELFGIQKRYSPEKFYIYIIKVERENQRVASYVMRRFSEFQELHRKLVLAFPLVRLPSLSNKMVIGRAHVRTVAEARKTEIEVFLQELLRLAPEVSRHDLVYTFFHPMLRDEQDVDKTNILKLKDMGTTNRNRSNSTNSIEGAIKLNMFYRGDTFTVMVMHVKSLGSTVSNDAPNPYVKLYLLPDPMKQTKRKTKISHSTYHPTYNEMLIYRCPLEVLKQRTLQVTVWSYEAMKENEFLGAAHICLNELDLSRECVAWHKLQTLHSISLNS